MACRICGSSPTIKAHLIPRAFAEEVRGDGKGMAVVTSDNASFWPAQTGTFDPDLLCAYCDAWLGNFENYAIRFIRYARNVDEVEPGTMREVSGVDTEKIIRFACGICWKFGNTKPDFGKIELGPYNTILAGLSFRNEAIPASIDCYLFRLKSHSSDGMMYRHPLPDRQDGVNIVRFSVGGFVIFLKLDKRHPSGFLSNLSTRGKNEIVFPVVPPMLFEEGRMSVEAPLQNSKLSRYLAGKARS